MAGGETLSQRLSILPEKLGTELLWKIHKATHLGVKKMQDLVRTAKIVIKDYWAKIEKIASDCKACLLTNPTKTSEQPKEPEKGEHALEPTGK